MATIIDAQGMLDEAFSTSDTNESRSGDGSSQTHRDYHQEMYPSYRPPHLRGHNVQAGDQFVNFKKTNGDNPDKIEGVDNDKYQRLILKVPFALQRHKLQRLKPQFPGVYFHTKDNGNHDHEFSHVVTMLGTRFMQRRYPVGTRILDLYGSPRACHAYNRGQERAGENARRQEAIVHKSAPADFIREVNKWGDRFDADNNELYRVGTLRSIIDDGTVDNYDVIQMVHTLYYVDFKDLSDALHYGDKRRSAYALIHRHRHLRGSINDGEQEYVKKVVERGGKPINLVKQVNVNTGSAYVHPDLTPLLFREKKVWLPEEELATRGNAGKQYRKGLTWDCHIVNDETWIVEFAAYHEDEIDTQDSWADMWERDEQGIDEDFNSEDPMFTPLSSLSPVSKPSMVSVIGNFVSIPAEDGTSVDIELTNMKLFSKLRANVNGKKRTPLVLEELVRYAKHLNDPSALFGDKEGMEVPPNKIMDHAVAAFVADVEDERKLADAVVNMKPVLREHAKAVGFGPSTLSLRFGDTLEAIRLLLLGAQKVNRVVKSKDKTGTAIDAMISHIDG